MNKRASTLLALLALLLGLVACTPRGRGGSGRSSDDDDSSSDDDDTSDDDDVGDDDDDASSYSGGANGSGQFSGIDPQKCAGLALLDIDASGMGGGTVTCDGIDFNCSFTIGSVFWFGETEAVDAQGDCLLFGEIEVALFADAYAWGESGGVSGELYVDTDEGYVSVIWSASSSN